MDYILYIMDREISTEQEKDKGVKKCKEEKDEDIRRWQKWMDYIKQDLQELQKNYAFYMK